MTPTQRTLYGRLTSLLRLLGPHWRLIACAVVSGTGHQWAVLATATSAAWLVGRSITGASPDALTPGLWVLCSLVIPVALLPWLESFLAHVAAFRVLADLRGRVYDAFERLSVVDLRERRSGDLGAVAISDVETLERFFAHALSPLIVASVVPVAAIAILGLVHGTLVIALLPTFVLLVSVPYWLRRRAEEHADAIRARLGELSAEAVDLVQGSREIVVFSAQQVRLQRLSERGAQLGVAKVEHSRRAGIEHAATDALTALGGVCALCVGAWLVAHGSVASWLFPVIVISAAASLQPVAAVLDVVRDLNVAGAAAERVSHILRAALEIQETQTPVHTHARADEATPHKSPRALAPEVRFEHVSYRYANDRPWALHDVSFEIRAGETVALVGQSGAGKSTLSSLLLRLWDVTGGCVRIAAQDIRQIPLSELRQLVTAVPQDVYLFNTTLRENIRLGAPHADDAAVEAAARAALAHDFIRELPAGYDTRAGELGVRLSGGQRQRIAIARALLREAPILVMDEAVSSMDAIGEREITAAIAELRRGRTSLIIAHRLSTIVGADRVLVLEHGKLVEQGTHQELVRRAGPYARLIASQLSDVAACV